ncbi:tripartite tricarboxylate transporter TctB family protein [Rhizobium sp. P32RR-XVIII]|uniref:tripartite tricarboxylate transporter TctB family protein n=1 Tax=Rhizobium sp. P32RR-XVIII TaxID=2726738 RepID=UPI001456ADEB|nr:tripartite tricarboxylate transporter TctB family protein [Rhizobium sp. P32RR-XVIII]NLS07068.1 tripartite tricarboxylate transporter TctB family protein [Rhizobium sp. P32RR-XVIII]
MKESPKGFSALAQNFAPPLVLLTITGIFIVASYGYPPASREVPLLVCYTLVVLIALDILSRTATRTGELVRKYLNPGTSITQMPKSEEEDEHPSGRRELLAVGWVAAFTAGVMLVGILPSVPVYLASYMILEGRKKPLFSILIAAAVVLFLWVSFEEILSIPLYRGVLFED